MLGNGLDIFVLRIIFLSKIQGCYLKPASCVSVGSALQYHGSLIILNKFKVKRFFTRGPYGVKGMGRALFTIDPDGNETEINTRYLYGKP